jgi:thymidylate kinase
MPLIAFEGLDQSGKETQAARLAPSSKRPGGASRR